MGSRKHGHLRFYELTKEEDKLHNIKNWDYAHGGRPLGNFERVAAILNLYPGFPYDTPAGVGVIYSLKQFDATLWSMAKRYKTKVERASRRMMDVSVYSKLIRIMLEDAEKHALRARRRRRIRRWS